MRGSLLGHTVESMQIPQFRSMVEADAGGLLEARAAVAAETGSRAPLDALLVSVLAGTPLLPSGTSMIAAFGMARPVVQIRNRVAVEVPTMTVSATFAIASSTAEPAAGSWPSSRRASRRPPGWQPDTLEPKIHTVAFRQ